MTADEINQLLHDADRAATGAEFAGRMRDMKHANELDYKAIGLYNRALNLDPGMADPAWKETGNRDLVWLRQNGFEQIAAIKGHEEGE